jgi:anti-sigma regulatory factor (Ser/Thr protein kinase)
MLPKRRLGGGEWYDAFTLPDGRVGFSIGCNAGSVRAGGAGGLVPQSLRDAAAWADSPADVLERTNAALAKRAEPPLGTALFGTLDPRSSTVTYAVAAHPPPVLTMPGFGTEVLPAGGNGLGTAEAVGAANWTFTLTPGSMLARYTGAEPARSIENAAALVLSPLDEAAAHDFYFEFSAIPFAVPIVRHALHRFAGRLGLGDERRFALVTAVGEAMANAVEHAYDGTIGTVRLRVASDADSFVATIEDFGRWKAAQTGDERGRGLPLMRALADAVEIRIDQRCTTISLRWAAQGVTVKAR